MESISTIKIEKEIDIKIEEKPYKVSKSYVGKYKEIGEKSFTTKFTLIKSEDEDKHISWEVILQDEFDESTTDMINKNILDQAEELI